MAASDVKELKFVDCDYIYENHVVGRLPLREPQSPTIVFLSQYDELTQLSDYEADVSASSESEDEPSL